MSTGISDFLQKYRYHFGMVFILIVAAFMRFYRLDALPPGLHPDEAANGLDIFRIIENHDFRPFYSFNGGREGLFFYLQAIGVLLLGNTTYALRVAPALIGTLATGAVYLWVSTWFSKRTGLIAAFLMAVTPWAVTISRDGFRASMVMLMIPLTLWLISRAIQTKQLHWALLAGISLGAGFYTYIAFRLFPLALVAALAYLFIWRRPVLKQWRQTIGAITLATAVTLVPMGIYAVFNPGDIVGRPGGVSFTNPDLNHGRPLQTLGDGIVKTALMFNIAGDENYRQNLGGQPEFNIFVGVMFILGIFICLMRITRLRYFGLLMVFGTMLMPEVLTAEGLPHALRAIGALPAGIALAAIGIDYMLQTWHNLFPLNAGARASASIAVIILLGLTAYQGYVQYFVAWGNSQQTYDAYAEDATALSAYYNTIPFNGKRYAATGEYGLFPVMFLTHNHATFTSVKPDEVDKLPLDTGTAKEFATYEIDREKVLKQLRLKFPKGHTSPHYSNFSGKELFVVYTVPAS